MAILEDRLSITVVDAPYIPPEETYRSQGFLRDIEAGPIAILDTSGGMNYQSWILTYVDPVITLTPQTAGVPVVADISPANATQLSFCFDQNARATIAYRVGTDVYLYWYDSDGAAFVTTQYPNYISMMLSLDDKREMEVSVNDILFWYTREMSPGVYNLYHRKQRDRFEVEHLMEAGTFPYFNAVGMHTGLRGKIALTVVNP